ncbi:hypothetical protein ACLOJK_006652 [Asimina triloba]
MEIGGAAGLGMQAVVIKPERGKKGLPPPAGPRCSNGAASGGPPILVGDALLPLPVELADDRFQWTADLHGCLVLPPVPNRFGIFDLVIIDRVLCLQLMQPPFVCFRLLCDTVSVRSLGSATARIGAGIKKGSLMIAATLLFDGFVEITAPAWAVDDCSLGKMEHRISVFRRCTKFGARALHVL